MLKRLQSFDNTFGQEEYEQQLTQHFIDPIKALGFDFTGYAHIGHIDNGATHLLQFEITDLGIANFNPQAIKDIMQDDDGQPMSLYRYWGGTLWVYIPYTP